MGSVTASGAPVNYIEDFILITNPSLSPSEATEIREAIYQYAVAYGIEPRLLASVIAVESSFNPAATGAKGEIGLGQLRPEYHLVGVANIEQRARMLYQIDTNLSVAARYIRGLKTVFEAANPKLLWIEFYNRGPSAKPKKFPYAKKVIKVYVQLGGYL